MQALTFNLHDIAGKRNVTVVEHAQSHKIDEPRTHLCDNFRLVR